MRKVFNSFKGHSDPDIEQVEQIQRCTSHEIFYVKRLLFFIKEMGADSAIFYADCRIANTFDAHV